MRVLLAEPNPVTAKAVELMLTSEGFNVYTTDSAEEALDLAKLYDYDIIIQELNFSDMSGLEVIRKLRSARVTTPIFALTSSDDLETKTQCFRSGADEFMTKPFNREELVARVQAVVRRSKGHSQNVITTGEMAVNLDNKKCIINGNNVHLTGKEFAMLELLSLRKGTTLSKEMFLDSIYGGMDEPELKIIDVFICKLRRKLSGANQGFHYIHTVWGRGYVLTDEPVEQAPSRARDSFGNAARPPILRKADLILEMAAIQRQLAEVRTELGLPEDATMADAMEKIRLSKLRAERMLDDPEPEMAIRSTGSELVVVSPVNNNFTNAAAPRLNSFEEGLRLPVGLVFRLGTLIEIDTNQGLAANISTRQVVYIPPVIGAIFEVLANFQGRKLNKSGFLDYIFENKHKSNETRLGMFMSQAQGKLTQLVGRDLAAMLVQVLSDGNYGMPEVSKLLAAPPPSPKPSAS